MASDPGRRVYDDILGAMGNTPIVKLNRIGRGLPAELYVKCEFMNPGGSIKDRIGWWMIRDAERSGKLKRGGTIIEGTSGNTGVGIAIASAIMGYKCVFVLPDKMSQEKIRNLRAFGAKVVVTPTEVEPGDPRSYYSVSRRLAKEIPNSLYIDQYNNLSNRECHYETTGPEILKQMPEMDVFVAGIGTGGTICGCAKAFKEKKPSIKVVAVDPIGSLVYQYFKTGKMTEAHSYKIEGIGEDFIPGNYDLSLVDDMVQVEDKESFLMTRDLLTKEGLYIGISSGAAIVGAIKWIQAQGDAVKGKKVLVILPDSGNRYLSKVYDDDWMKEAGFLDTKSVGTVDDLIHYLHVKPGQIVMARQTDKISSVIDLLKDKGFSQLPVTDGKGWIKGVISEGAILKAIYEGRAKPTDVIEILVDPAIEFVKPEDPVERISRMLTEGKYPLVTDPAHEGQILAILTKIDLLSFLGSRG